MNSFHLYQKHRKNRLNSFALQCVRGDWDKLVSARRDGVRVKRCGSCNIVIVNTGNRTWIAFDWFPCVMVSSVRKYLYSDISFYCMFQHSHQIPLVFGTCVDVKFAGNYSVRHPVEYGTWMCGTRSSTGEIRKRPLQYVQTWDRSKLQFYF